MPLRRAGDRYTARALCRRHRHQSGRRKRKAGSETRQTHWCQAIPAQKYLSPAQTIINQCTQPFPPAIAPADSHHRARHSFHRRLLTWAPGRPGFEAPVCAITVRHVLLFADKTSHDGRARSPPGALHLVRAKAGFRCNYRGSACLPGVQGSRRVLAVLLGGSGSAPPISQIATFAKKNYWRKTLPRQCSEAVIRGLGPMDQTAAGILCSSCEVALGISVRCNTIQALRTTSAAFSFCRNCCISENNCPASG